MYSRDTSAHKNEVIRSSAEPVGEEVQLENQSLQPPVLSLKASPIQREEMPEEELQMKASPMQRQEIPEEEEVQMKPSPIQLQEMPEEEEVQMKAKPIQRSSTRTSLPENVQAQMEDTFQSDFSDVNIHTNSSSAPEVGALAYTQGSDIHFAQGQYNPTSSAGQELIGHELAHVVQQREGRVSPTTEISGMPVNDDAALEREADQMGQKATQRKRE